MGPDQCPRDSDALAFANRKPAAAFPYHRVVAIRRLRNEQMRVGEVGGVFDLGDRRLRLCVSNVVAHGIVE